MIISKLHSIKGHYAEYYGTKMIELPNGLVAISSDVEPYPIVIVDPISYSIIKEIKEEGYITDCSSLCVLDQHSFIYACRGNVVQIAIDNKYRILYKTNGEQQLSGYGGVVNVRGGEYFIVENRTGFKVIKPYYY